MDAFAARIACAVVYPLLAHWASHDGRGWVAALALADLALVILIEPLLQRRGWAWAVYALLLAGLWALARTPHAQLLLLAPPVLFVGLVAWFFGRTLRAPRVPLITRIAAAMEDCTPAQLPPRMVRYTRGLTTAWTVLLAVLAVLNAVLALVAVPDGVLDRLGHPPRWGVPREHWSLIANLLNWGVIGGFFAGEYALRRRFFPDRPYRSLLEFLRHMGRLDPAFWRGLFR